MVAQIAFVADNELTRFLDAEIAARFKSAENLSRQSGLAAGTVRNILKSGNASNATLAKLAVRLGKTRAQLAAMAGQIEDDASEEDPFAEGLLAAGRLIPERDRAAFLRGVLATARGWEPSPEHQN